MYCNIGYIMYCSSECIMYMGGQQRVSCLLMMGYQIVCVSDIGAQEPAGSCRQAPALRTTQVLSSSSPMHFADPLPTIKGKGKGDTP